MSRNVKYRIAALTEAAGKYDPNAPQEGNEDNYGITYNIGVPTERIGFDEVTDLGAMGLLMYVADGMGGHNAGEVASKIAVDTVVEQFAEGRVSAGIAESHEARRLYMEGVIKEADKRIRAYAKQHKECEGMGSTLIIAWLKDGELTVSWCGDSRCYLYRAKPRSRIAMVSEDHSYVQELVQRGVIPYEATFGHPRGNIVTRCLGGGGSNSQPESIMVRVGKGDIILLCSDGLSGVLFDDGRQFDGQPISEENICDTIASHETSMREALRALFAAAERSGWYDNVTAILCQIAEGEETDDVWPPMRYSATPSRAEKGKTRRKLWWVVIVIACLLATGGGVWWYLTGREKKTERVVPAVKDIKYNAKEQSITIVGATDKYGVRVYKVVENDTTMVMETVVNDTVFRLPKIEAEETVFVKVQAIDGTRKSLWRARNIAKGKKQKTSDVVQPPARKVAKAAPKQVETEKPKSELKLVPVGGETKEMPETEDKQQ